MTKKRAENSFEDKVHQFIEEVVKRTEANLECFQEDFPDYFDRLQNRWFMNGFWTEGFWAGFLWLTYVWTRDDRFLHRASQLSKKIIELKSQINDHDLGFLFFYSCVLGFQLTGEVFLKNGALKAAYRLKKRFNPRGRFIPAHGDPISGDQQGYAIIDTIMNLQLLFWAFEISGDETLYQVGCDTAETILYEYVRPDFSSYQVVCFDPVSGKVREKGTLQGYDHDSCWARGQAWGVYGFGCVYQYTGITRYRDTAFSMAGHFLDHSQQPEQAFYDLTDPNIPNVPRDASASSILASALVHALVLSAGAKRRHWRKQAEALIASLIDDSLEHLRRNQAGGILPHSCYFYSRDKGVDCEWIVGDYFLLEAVSRYALSVPLLG